MEAVPTPRWKPWFRTHDVTAVLFLGFYLALSASMAWSAEQVGTSMLACRWDYCPMSVNRLGMGSSVTYTAGCLILPHIVESVEITMIHIPAPPEDESEWFRSYSPLPIR